jgi:hypothetical protein
MPMHYLPLTAFGSKDYRSPKRERGDLLTSAYLGLRPLHLHNVGELRSYVLRYDLGANKRYLPFFAEVAGCTSGSFRPKCPMFRTKFLASTLGLLGSSIVLMCRVPYNS